MTVITSLPRGLKNSDFVRNSPEKQLSAEAPPIQFVPSSIPKARNATKKVHIKITFPSKVTKAFQVFFAGDLEQAINHVQVVKSILEDKQVEKEIKFTRASLHQKKESLRRLEDFRSRADMGVTPSTHTRFHEGVPEESPAGSGRNRAGSGTEERVSSANLEALRTAVLELKGKLSALHQSAFDTFEQTLAAPLQVSVPRDRPRRM